VHASARGIMPTAHYRQAARYRSINVLRRSAALTLTVARTRAQ
jgi:hypothetical protein